MFVRSTDSMEICGIVCNLKSNKSPGHDEISSNVIKSVIPLISDVLTNIFNLSLSSSVFFQINLKLQKGPHYISMTIKLQLTIKPTDLFQFTRLF